MKVIIYIFNSSVYSLKGILVIEVFNLMNEDVVNLTLGKLIG